MGGRTPLVLSPPLLLNTPLPPSTTSSVYWPAYTAKHSQHKGPAGKRTTFQRANVLHFDFSICRSRVSTHMIFAQKPFIILPRGPKLPLPLVFLKPPPPHFREALNQASQDIPTLPSTLGLKPCAQSWFSTWRLEGNGGMDHGDYYWGLYSDYVLSGSIPPCPTKQQGAFQPCSPPLSR